MIKTVGIDLLVPFENHPFKERNGIKQQELIAVSYTHLTLPTTRNV